MDNSEHTYRLSISQCLGITFIGSFVLFILICVLVVSAKDIISGGMDFSGYLEIIFIFTLLFPFGVFLLAIPITTKVVVKTSGIEYHTPVFVMYADWQYLDNIGYIRHKGIGKTLVVVSRRGDLLLKGWTKPFRKLLKSIPMDVKF